MGMEIMRPWKQAISGCFRYASNRTKLWWKLQANKNFPWANVFTHKCLRIGLTNMVLVLSEINCTLLKERLKSGQNCIENQPLGTPEGLISRTRLKNGRWTWNFDILHKSTWLLCVPILSEIARPSFPSLPRSLRQKLLSRINNCCCGLETD